MVKVKYQEVIDYLVGQVGVSEYQVRQVVKQIGFLIQDKVKRGYDIDIEPLFSIKYQVKGRFIYENTIYRLPDIIQDCIKLYPNYREETIQVIIELYIKYLYESLERGMSVGIKGVATILVEDQNNQVVVTGRMSPQLDKTEHADFIEMVQGELAITVFNKDDLRLSLVLSDKIKVPRRVRKDTQVIGYEKELVTE